MSWSFFDEAFLRSLAVLLAGDLLLRVSSRQTPVFRHRLLVGVFVSLAALPVLCVLLPSIAIPLWHAAPVVTSTVAVAESSSRVLTKQIPHQIAWPALLWLLGFVVTLASGFVGAFRVFRITRSARAFRAETLTATLERLGSEVSVPPVLLSDQIVVPLACNVFRPCILLPGGAANWTAARLHAVLAHELSHIRRRDIGIQVFAHVVCAVWWFQPLVWLFRSRLRRESEMACDAEALRSDLKPSVYASELLAIAKSLGKHERLSSLAIGMARPKHLEARIRAVLTPSITASSTYRQLSTAALLVMFAAASSAFNVSSANHVSKQGESTMKNTLLSALVTSVGLSAATITGSVNGITGEPIPDAKVLVSNPDTGAKQELTTTSDGTFSIAGAGAGQYILRVEKPGFNSAFRVFDVKADSNINRQITMVAPGTQPAPDTVKDSEKPESNPLRVKGTVAQANLVTKVPPQYPPDAKLARVQGTVELEVTITKDGVPNELRVVSSPSDDLSESAIEAVRQWRYRPTLLNGVPVEIVSSVIVNYTLLR